MTDSDVKKVELIIKFLEVTKGGMTKPYDPSPFLRKLDAMKRDGVNIDGLEVCCPTSAEVNDAKDFKPYIESSLRLYAELMGLKLHFH